MEIVVKGRHLSLDVGESFRQHCVEKLSRLERLDQRLMRLDVELSHESNKRQQSSSERVEITVRTRGPVVRAEAAATDCYAAFEKAFGKLEERLRRAASKRTASHSHSHHAHVPAVAAGEAAASNGTSPADDPGLAPGEREVAGGIVVREKEHAAIPMRIDDALHAMELVGHDFYLFSDAETGQPSVVYRRKGYDYGVLRLTVGSAGSPAAEAAPAAVSATA